MLTNQLINSNEVEVNTSIRTSTGIRARHLNARQFFKNASSYIVKKEEQESSSEGLSSDPNQMIEISDMISMMLGESDGKPSVKYTFLRDKNNTPNEEVEGDYSRDMGKTKNGGNPDRHSEFIHGESEISTNDSETHTPARTKKYFNQ